MAFDASPKKAPCTFRQVFSGGVGESKDSDDALARLNLLWAVLRKRSGGCILAAQKLEAAGGDGFPSEFDARNDEIHLFAIRLYRTCAVIRSLFSSRACVRKVSAESGAAIASRRNNARRNYCRSSATTLGKENHRLHFAARSLSQSAQSREDRLLGADRHVRVLGGSPSASLEVETGAQNPRLG